MADQVPSNSSNTSNEIDLGQLFELIKKGFNNLFKWFLRIFLYLKKNLFKLIALVAIGVAIGFAVKTFVPKKLKSEIIVKPNFESKDYLYATIDEIASNIQSRDTIFFKKMGIDMAKLADFNVEIQPIEEEEVDKEVIEQNNKYLETLQNYKDNEFVLGIIKSEILQKSASIHRITFMYKDAIKGEEYAEKIIGYINTNPYFNELQKISTQNAQTRITKNKGLIEQIDNLISSYSKNLANRESATSQSQGMVLFDNENSLNIPNLLGQKNKLIREIENKQIEIVEQTKAINILNFGKTQAVKKPLFSKNLVLFPAILLGGFFLFSLLSFLNKKSKELI